MGIAAGTAPGDWEVITSFASSKPVPVVLDVATTVQVPGDTTPFVDTDLIEFPRVSPVFGVAATNDWPDAVLQGALRVTYGANGALQTRIMDPRSGSYCLPPSNTVKVEGRFYNERSVPSTIAWRTTASLAEGSLDRPAVPIVSGWRFIATPGSWQQTVSKFQGLSRIRFAAMPAFFATTYDCQLAVVDTQPPFYVDYSLLPYLITPVPDLIAVNQGIISCVKTGADDIVMVFEQELDW